MTQNATAEPPRAMPLATLPPPTAEMAAIGNLSFAALIADKTKLDTALMLADIYAKSDSVPQQYRGKRENCFIAMQLSARLQVELSMLMQNTYVVHGKLGMDGKLVISLVNDRGPFTGPIQYEYIGKPGTDDYGCRAFVTHAKTGHLCESTVTVGMAKKAGWWANNDNWRNLTDLMLGYRSATFLARLHCPSVLMGMQAVDEIRDAAPHKVESWTLEPLTGEAGKVPGGYWEARKNGDDEQAQRLIGGDQFAVERIDDKPTICRRVKASGGVVADAMEAAPKARPPAQAAQQNSNGSEAVIRWFLEGDGRRHGMSKANLEAIVDCRADRWNQEDIARLREVCQGLNGGKKRSDFLPTAATTTPNSTPVDLITRRQNTVRDLCMAFPNPGESDVPLRDAGIGGFDSIGDCGDLEKLDAVIAGLEAALKVARETAK